MESHDAQESTDTASLDVYHLETTGLPPGVYPSPTQQDRPDTLPLKIFDKYTLFTGTQTWSSLGKVITGANPLSGIEQGTDHDERIGRQINVGFVSFQYLIKFDSVGGTVASVNIGSYVWRITFFIDHQHGAAIGDPTYSDVFNVIGIPLVAYPEPSESDRFEVLCDKIYHIQPSWVWRDPGVGYRQGTDFIYGAVTFPFHGAQTLYGSDGSQNPNWEVYVAVSYYPEREGATENHQLHLAARVGYTDR